MSLESPGDLPSHDPADLAGNVRTLAAEVWRRVVEWRDAPGWHEDSVNQQRYDVTAEAATALNTVPQTPGPVTAAKLSEAIQPILDTWRPNRAGPEQAIYAAVDRLRDATRRLNDSGR